MCSNNDFDLAGLKILPGLADVRYFPSLGSTNDMALDWAAAGAQDGSLVLADEQTSGRGRMGRKWYTAPAAALAFSLVLRPKGRECDSVGLFSGLGALALVDALQRLGVDAQIKWPNDVLIHGEKVAGILVEAVWQGEVVEGIILGVGVNVSPEALPPAAGLNFPATCVQNAVKQPVSRGDLLTILLEALLRRREQLASDGFRRDWEAALAFRGAPVQVWAGKDQPLFGLVRGLQADGSLVLETESGILETIHFGEVHLRPA
jgi:BirA family biotin operon repressor/biotin-[acetyl-CoA-carboxylase] ligase